MAARVSWSASPKQYSELSSNIRFVVDLPGAFSSFLPFCPPLQDVCRLVSMTFVHDEDEGAATADAPRTEPSAHPALGTSASARFVVGPPHATLVWARACAGGLIRCSRLRSCPSTSSRGRGRIASATRRSGEHPRWARAGTLWPGTGRPCLSGFDALHPRLRPLSRKSWACPCSPSTPTCLSSLRPAGKRRSSPPPPLSPYGVLFVPRQRLPLVLLTAAQSNRAPYPACMWHSARPRESLTTRLPFSPCAVLAGRSAYYGFPPLCAQVEAAFYKQQQDHLRLPDVEALLAAGRRPGGGTAVKEKRGDGYGSSVMGSFEQVGSYLSSLPSHTVTRSCVRGRRGV